MSQLLTIRCLKLTAQFVSTAIDYIEVDAALEMDNTAQMDNPPKYAQILSTCWSPQNMTLQKFSAPPIV